MPPGGALPNRPPKRQQGTDMPDNAQPEQYQTFVFDGNTYKSIGPFDTEEELFNALKEYTDTEVEAGTMSQAEATALLEKYQ